MNPDLRQGLGQVKSEVSGPPCEVRGLDGQRPGGGTAGPLSTPCAVCTACVPCVCRACVCVPRVCVPRSTGSSPQGDTCSSGKSGGPSADPAFTRRPPRTHRPQHRVSGDADLYSRAGMGTRRGRCWSRAGDPAAPGGCLATRSEVFHGLGAALVQRGRRAGGQFLRGGRRRRGSGGSAAPASDAVVGDARGLLLQRRAGRPVVGGPRTDVARPALGPGLPARACAQPPGRPQRHLAVQRRLRSWGRKEDGERGGAAGEEGGPRPRPLPNLARKLLILLARFPVASRATPPSTPPKSHPRATG